MPSFSAGSTCILYKNEDKDERCFGSMIRWGGESSVLGTITQKLYQHSATSQTARTHLIVVKRSGRGSGGFLAGDGFVVFALLFFGHVQQARRRQHAGAGNHPSGLKGRLAPAGGKGDLAAGQERRQEHEQNGSHHQHQAW